MDVASGPDKRGTMWYLLPDGKGATTRSKDPPPADMKPNPDYEPKVGEWFWFKQPSGSVWYRYCRQENNMLTNEGGQTTHIGWLASDKGKCLPATPPE